MNTYKDDGSIVLAQNGSSDWKIVTEPDAGETIARATQVLAKMLYEISGAKIPVTNDAHDTGPKEIRVGNRNSSLDEQAYRIAAREDHITIAGGGDQGALNGVYGFLEDVLGCRWLTSTVHHIPTRSTLSIAPFECTDGPAFAYREVFYRDSWYRDFAEPNRINGQGAETRQEMLKEIHRGWGTWCHTFEEHVPPATYFESHPEYYSMVNGKRIPDGQLCLTNGKVFELVVDDLKRMMANQPDALYWSVSQNDRIKNCTCEKCSAIDDAEGTPMGSLLTFVNRVASEFPDKIISTLAYQYTRKPPRTIRPADNVHIMLCNIECNRSRPIAVDPDSTPFREDLLAWAAVSENLFIWDYVVQFAHLVSPFPNFRVLGPNIKLFAENNVRGIFSQGNREVGGEFSELRAYILAKLSWDINYDVERGIQEFLDLYYGPAAEPIGRYMKRIHNTLDQSHSQLRIFEGPQEAATTYLREQLIGEYIGLFDDAEAAVGDDGELLLRVRTARLPLQYAILRLSYGTEALRRRELDSFAEVSALTGLEKVEEWRYTVSAFVNDMRKALQ